jgi:hypothetical protein
MSISFSKGVILQNIWKTYFSIFITTKGVKYFSNNRSFYPEKPRNKKGFFSFHNEDVMDLSSFLT